MQDLRADLGKLHRPLQPSDCAAPRLTRPPRRGRASISLYFLGLDLALLAAWGHLEPGYHAPLALLLVSATLVSKVLGTALFGGSPKRSSASS